MMTRQIDDLGRIVIPKDIRKAIGVNSGDTMEISINGNSVVLTKHFETRTDELLSTIALVEDEELRNKLYGVYDEWNKGRKAREQ